MPDVTQILNCLGQGDPHAAEQLLPLVYQELRRLAAQKLASEIPGQTLEPTGLVHEAYLRLVGADNPLDPQADAAHWGNRKHFFAAAAEAMRRILIDNARRKRRPKHGGGRQRVDWNEVQAVAQASSTDVLAVDEAITRLAREDPTKAELVKLRFFGGLTMPEVARVLGLSLATTERHWTYARTWLYAELRDMDGVEG